MKLSVVVFGVLAACAMSYAVEHGPLIAVLQPQDTQQVAVMEPGQPRQKRGLLLAGALGAGAVGLGAAALGAGALGAGALGVGIIGAKAGFIGGAIASRAFHGRSYGGYSGGYGGSYGSYGSYGGYGGYGGYYSSPSYYSTPYYRSSYPVYVEEEWC